jgi:hypothetical protein
VVVGDIADEPRHAVGFARGADGGTTDFGMMQQIGGVGVARDRFCRCANDVRIGVG